MIKYVLLVLLLSTLNTTRGQDRIRDLGLEIGIFKTGANNHITDVRGVSVGHKTIVRGSNIRTGVTAIIPDTGNLFQNKLPAAIHLGNGFGKLAGYSQVEELGNIETPIILTNTLSVSAGIEGLIRYTLDQPSNHQVRSVNAVVGETNDGRLNDIRGLHVTVQDVFDAIESASSDNTQEGNIGAGTGTICFGYKGGIGSSSRVLPSSLGGHTIGVLVQSNFGGVLDIDGIPFGKLMNQYPFASEIQNPDGSCMIVVVTDAPLDSRNLKRLAKRAMLGLARTGGMSSNGSGDYVIAVSTARNIKYPYQSDTHMIEQSVLRNDAMSPLFQAVIESTEEAILNSLMAAQDMTGRNNYFVPALDKDKLKDLIKQHKK